MSAEPAIREAIKVLLDQFVAAPLLNAREKDYQAVLFRLLRDRFPTRVAVALVDGRGRRLPHQWADPSVSRVHLEMCIGEKGSSGESIRPDIVLLRDKDVELRCSPDGPTDIQETLRRKDVEAAIEIKAAPSRNLAEATKFTRDVLKLAAQQERHSELLCFAVVIDKSISIPPWATAAVVGPSDWLGTVSPHLQRHEEMPTKPFVEVWFIDPVTCSPMQTFFKPLQV